MKVITTKIEEQQDQRLKSLSKASHVPVSALIRKGIDLLLKQSQEDMLTSEFRKEVEAVILEDRDVLKRLAE
ncbi:MAG: ribbon-helix-helix domain-containing protein [Candidatus Omnitrophica bacterium]|nr:ribbon-helix-helix domain-containing protein [Candidatus Omnitrophota bacterium]